MLTKRSRLIAALLGIVPGSCMAYSAGIIAIGTGYELVTGGPTASVLAFGWAVAGLIGYVGLWVLVCSRSPNRWLVRICVLAGLVATVPVAFMGQVWWWPIVCAGPIAIGGAALFWSFQRREKDA